MTSEAVRVCQWPSLESSFLQPECIADVFRRFSDEFIIRFALRVLRLMTIFAIRIRVLLMREKDSKF